jgi:hypothetical protein
MHVLLNLWHWFLPRSTVASHGKETLSVIKATDKSISGPDYQNIRREKLARSSRFAG